MGGVLTHISVAFISALIIYFIHFRLEFSMGMFLGNLIPDVIKFGITAIIYGTFNFAEMISTKTYQIIMPMTDSVASWFSIGFFIFALTIFLYHYHIIKKKRMEEYDELYVFLIIGILIHFLIDFFVIETNPWI